MWFVDKDMKRTAIKRVMVLDVAPPCLIFLKDFRMEDGKIKVLPTFHISESISIGNTPNDKVTTEIMDDIRKEYPTYNPLIVDMAISYEIKEAYGDPKGFYHVKKKMEENDEKDKRTTR